MPLGLFVWEIGLQILQEKLGCRDLWAGGMQEAKAMRGAWGHLYLPMETRENTEQPLQCPCENKIVLIHVQQQSPQGLQKF